MRFLVAIALIAILLVSFTTTSPVNVRAQQNSEDTDLIDATMRINLVMIGDTWSSRDQEQLLRKLLKSYVPEIFYEERPAGVKYTYRYSFDSLSAERSNQLFDLMNRIGVENTMPEFIVEWMRSEHPELGRPDRQMYKMINAFAVEEWLAKLDREPGYTIYFIKPPDEKLDFFRTYGTVMKDPDTGREFMQEGMMGFGGNYRFYFIDLYAGPWLYPYVPTGQDSFVGQFHRNLYDIDSDEDYYELVADHVNNIILLLLTPSYIYSPVYKVNYKIDIFLIDMTSGRVFRDVSDRFIHKTTIENAFAKLIPYAKWQSDIQGHTFDSLPRELQRAILRSITFKAVQGSDMILVRSSDLIAELNRWVASNLPQEAIEAAEREAEETVFLPVVLFVFDKEAYVDKEAILGTAVPNPGDESEPCCAVVAVDKRVLFDIGTGLSTITIHEMGHILGLRHPHDGNHPEKGEFSDWFYDWSYTPMTYASPSGLGCGFAHACGLVVTEFGQFNYDTMDRGIVLYLMNKAKENIRESLLIADQKGYATDLPSSINSNIVRVERDLDMSRDHFERMVYFNHTTFKDATSIMNPLDDAFDFAFRAVSTSEELLSEVSEMPFANRLLINSIDILGPIIVDTSGSVLDTGEIGERVGISSRISNNLEEDVSFTYIVQVRDSEGVTVFLSWLDDLSVTNGRDLRYEIFWNPASTGEFEVQIFAWKGVQEPVPLAPVKSMKIFIAARS